MSLLEQLVRDTIAGSQAAWTELQVAVCGHVENIARRHDAVRRSGLNRVDDDIREIQTMTLERLAAHQFQNLRRFIHQLDDASIVTKRSFESWIYTAAEYVIRDHLRDRMGYRSRAEPDPSKAPLSSPRELHTFARPLDDVESSALAHNLGITRQLTVNSIIDFVEAHFELKEILAFRLHYLLNCSFEEIAEQLGMADAQDAVNLLRALTARLRYKFNDET